MADRYYIDTPITTQRVALAGPEARHLAGVMRAKINDMVTLFDGCGAEFAARIVTVSKDRVECEIVSRSDEDRELTVRLIFGVALPKGDRQRWLVEKLVELGVAELIPIHTERGIVQPDEGTVARLERYVLEASKQCGRNRLMTIAAPKEWRDWLRRAPPTALRFAAHPGAPELTLPSSDGQDEVANREVFVAIGPEGGFTDRETRELEATGWRLISLGRRILRVETAACYLASVLGHALRRD